MTTAIEAYSRCLRAIDSVAAQKPLELRNALIEVRTIIVTLIAATDPNAALAAEHTPYTAYPAIKPQGRTPREFMKEHSG